MNPYRVWKTLDLHGSMTARQIAAQWAAVRPSEVRPLNERRVEAALDVLHANDLVQWWEPPRCEPRQDRQWETLPLPNDDIERKALLKHIEKEWRRIRPTVTVSPD